MLLNLRANAPEPSCECSWQIFHDLCNQLPPAGHRNGWDALSVICTDAPRAREFYFGGLGMTEKGEALTITLNGGTTLSYFLETSEDLATWTPIASYTLTTPVTDFEIPTPTGVLRRFYRFRFVP